MSNTVQFFPCAALLSLAFDALATVRCPDATIAAICFFVHIPTEGYILSYTNMSVLPGTAYGKPVTMTFMQNLHNGRGSSAGPLLVMWSSLLIVVRLHRRCSLPNLLKVFSLKVIFCENNMINFVPLSRLL